MYVRLFYCKGRNPNPQEQGKGHFRLEGRELKESLQGQYLFRLLVVSLHFRLSTYGHNVATALELISPHQTKEREKNTTQQKLQQRSPVFLYQAVFISDFKMTSLVAQMVKCLPAMSETWVQSLSQEDPLEKEMATHSSTFAWKIPWTEEPGRLQSMGSQRVGHD